MEQNNFHFRLVLKIRKPLAPIRERRVSLQIKHKSQSLGKAEAYIGPSKGDLDQEDWNVVHKLSGVRLYDTIKIEFIVDLGKASEERSSVYIPHQDLFDAAKTALANENDSIERKFTLVKDSIKNESILGDMFITLSCKNFGGHLPTVLYEKIDLAHGETLQVKMSNNNYSKEWVGMKNEKGEKLMWVKMNGASKFYIMRGNTRVGSVLLKERFFPAVSVSRSYTLIYHGERICRAKFEKMDANAIIEFYNGDLPIALNGEIDHLTRNTSLITATRANEVIARFTFDKRKKMCITFYHLTFKNESDFPLLAFMATILGTQRIA